MNEEKKENKLRRVAEFIDMLELNRDDVIMFLSESSQSKEVYSLDNYVQIKEGMIWYEDDTFSFDLIHNKKIKAVVELVENGIIYGNLAASDLCSIPTKNLMSWYNAKDLISRSETGIGNFVQSYSCNKNEKIVWYNLEQLKKVYKKQFIIKNTFKMLQKEYYCGNYWSSTELNRILAWGLNFETGYPGYALKNILHHVPMMLALKVE